MKAFKLDPDFYWNDLVDHIGQDKVNEEMLRMEEPLMEAIRDLRCLALWLGGNARSEVKLAQFIGLVVKGYQLHKLGLEVKKREN